MMGDWPAVRVLAICLGWIILAPLTLLWRVAVRVHTRPPVLLFGLWLLARSRPD
jgi:hypothetical protein